MELSLLSSFDDRDGQGWAGMGRYIPTDLHTVAEPGKLIAGRGV